MNILKQLRSYNKLLYTLSLDVSKAELEALPRAIRYDSVGGSKGQAVSQIEKAFIRVDEALARYIVIKETRDRLAEEVKRAAYKSSVTEREYLVCKMLYLETKQNGKPYTWDDLINEMARLYKVKDRQVYNYHATLCNKILNILE